MTTTKRAIAYVRVSSEEQADSGLGLEAQRQRIDAYCLLKGLTLAAVYEDAGVSAGKPLDTRPAGAQLLADARKTKAVVICAKLDRLFRSVADAATTIADFEKKGVELVCIAEGFDMSSPYGKAMSQMAAVFAELERAMIRERTKSAMAVKRKKGERISGTAPFGFDFVPVTPPADFVHQLAGVIADLEADAAPKFKLVPNAVEQDAIDWMRQLRQEGKPYEAIAAALDEKGVKPKQATKWARATVRAILARQAA